MLVRALFRSLQRLRAAIVLALAVLAPLPSAGQTGGSPLLFEVRSQAGTAYLFGTIHVGSRRLYPLKPQVERAFTAADALVLEANPLNQEEVVAAMSRGTYQPPDNLERHVSAPLYEQVKAIAPKIGLPIEYARSLKPHLLAMTLTLMEVQRLGYDANSGLDVYLARRAQQSGKKILELESMQAQVELFDTLPADAQAGLLQMALDSIADDTIGPELETLIAAWLSGDAEALHASVERETEGLPEPVASELHARIYDRRNEAMSAGIVQLLEERRVLFVAVGAGHLTGAGGIPALLRQRGLQVRRL